jgi:hypothetical protein
MSRWLSVPEGEKNRLYEVKGAIKEEPLDAYADLYRKPTVEPMDIKLADIQRHIDEVLIDLDPGCSLLLFGAGHSVHANTYHEKCDNVEAICAMDIVADASVGLHSEIEFICADIFEYEFSRQYDYVFTTHTLEHFTREPLLETVIPKLTRAAKKALIVLVPYAEAWSNCDVHRSRFYENDEVAELASRYKIIRDGMEIVYWIEGYNGNTPISAGS